MKKGMKILAASMAAAMVVSSVPVNAASRTGLYTSNSFRSWWESLWNKGSGNETAETETEAPDESIALALVEDESTVENGEMLRASTYAEVADSSVSAQAESTTLKYFPVTMYDYDTTTINNATHQAEVNDGLGDIWNGIYFSNGSPAAESYTEPFSVEEGTYIIQNARAKANKVGSWLVGDKNGITSTTGEDSATRWTIQSNDDGTYTLRSTNGYMTIGSGADGDKTADTASNIEIVSYGGNKATIYGGYGTNNDSGNAFYLYKVTGSGTEQVIPKTASTASLRYAAWNWWNKNTDDNNYGQYTYSGLVESTLTAEKDITFTKPDGGIFDNSNTNVKDIYTNVEMPFVYEDGTYTFDASQNGVYFAENTEQGSTAAQSDGRLYFNEGNPQSNGGSYGDGSSTVWMPFNSTQNIGSESNCNYHFGMRTTIPFTMTANGKMSPTDDRSEDIQFSFSGDDDVWIFIDGQLVIDLGGIHNRLDAAINFAENTWNISKSNKVSAAVRDYNGTAISGTIFNENGKKGTLNQTRETFAAKDSHELTIFYLERGAGSSNCKIEFNLPMKDTVTVTKHATKSISENGTVSPLTAKEQETVNNIDFGFTLTKDGKPVANTNYNLLNANGQIISTPSTDAYGHFTLRNGQSARFVGEIVADGAEYRVVEDAVGAKGFKLPTYTYSGTAAGGYTVSDREYSEGTSIPSTAERLTSAAVTATGSTEAKDSLQFICENYFDANLPNPSSRPVDDKIVIDYGLPVEIDVLANDVYRGDRIKLENVTGAQYGKAVIKDGKIKYQLTQQLTGVEVLTYTATVTGSGNSGSETTTASESNTAKVYIIPATSMYYEEDFNGLVTFTGNWEATGTAQTDCQEPGVVGTVDDSPYGSDAAYLNDGGDSNGSSRRVDTTNGAAQFSYRFTGTGTSFFARTGSTAAYMRVVIQDSDGNSVYTGLRNNIYKSVEGTEVGTLYNVPVFTYEADNYGTYTVTVTLAKADAKLGHGKDFYLDGIRVVKPLDSADGNVSAANAAYAADGEANMAIATLREKLLGEASINEDGTLSWDGKKFVVFTDSNGEITAAEEYRSNGPKEEVYLNQGQSVTFSLKDWDANSNKIYLGVKAPLGSGSVSINGHALSLGNAADCYYDISGYADVTTDEDGSKIATFEVTSTKSLVSVTNIKVTGNAEFTIVNENNINAGDAEGSDVGTEIEVQADTEAEEAGVMDALAAPAEAETEETAIAETGTEAETEATAEMETEITAAEKETEVGTAGEFTVVSSKL